MIKCGFPEVRSGGSLVHVEAAAAVDFAEDAAAEVDGADDGSIDGSDLSGLRINTDGSARVGEQVGGVVVRLIIRVRIELQRFEDTAVANLA